MANNSLVIVESPSKAKTISKYLGPGFTVRATVGHIADLPSGKGKGLGVDIKNGFKPKYEVIPDKKDKIKAILDAARTADTIYIASDPDREGEAIAFHIAHQLKKLKKNIKRADFYEITRAGVKKAIGSPRELDNDLYQAQQARRVLDRIVGFMVSPYLCQKMGDKLSAGRVQSVALRMIVEREKEIEAFVPEEYFNITAALAKTTKSTSFIAKYPKKITDVAKADAVKKDLDTSSYEVAAIKAEEKDRPPAPPLTTSTLQQDAAARFKMPGERTMRAAQSLFESGLITYIRTDSVRSSPESITAVREWLEKESYEKPDRPNSYKTKNAAQDAHEAIRPTDVSNTPDLAQLSGDQQKIYRLIWAKFVASQMKPAVYDTVDVDISTSSGHTLKAEGKVLKYAGWLDIAGDFAKKDKDVKLPKLVVGDNLVLVPPKVKIEKKATKPPSRYNDRTIIKEMEKKDIGRPSTYASIIARIFNRNYVKREKSGFVPTELGCTVVDDLKGQFSFMDYKYTAEMEKQLDKMSEGNLDYVEMLTTFFTAFKEEFRKAQNSQAQDAGLQCPNCGEKMVVRHGKFGYFASCVKYPDCKGSMSGTMKDGKFFPKSGKKREAVPDIKCPKCGGEMYRFDGKFGPIYLCIKYPKCDGKRKIPFGKKCNKCGNEFYLTVFDDEPKLACMGYPNCKNIIDVPKGAKIDWVPPSKVAAPKKLHRRVEKVLK